MTQKESDSMTILKILLTVFLAAMISIACKERSEDSTRVKATERPTKAQINPEFFPIEGPTDAIYRNRMITRNYYFGGEILNQALANDTATGAFQANWLHFGIWGSMRAGETMNGVDLQLALTAKDFVFDYLEQSLAWLPYGLRDHYIDNIKRERDLIDTVNKIVRQSLAAGNQRVANEIIGVTDRYVRMLGCETTMDEAHLQNFLGTFEYQLDKNATMAVLWQNLLAKIPALTKGALHKYGQDSLARAFEAYHRSRFQRDLLTKTQMIHFGNLMIAIHEQYVLQTYVAGAIGILDPASSLYRKLATIIAMDLGLPGEGFKGVANMGEGLQRYPLRRGFPASGFDPMLRQYRWPPLVELSNVTGLDKNSGRGATDWQDYQSRIYHIGGLMRTMHSKRSIASFPFSGPHPEAALHCSP